MSSKLGRVNAVKKSRNIRVFTDVKKIIHDVGVVVVSEVIKVLNIGVVVKGRVTIAATQFVAAHVVNGFFFGAVLIDLPGEKLIEGVTGQTSTREQIVTTGARFRKNLGLIGGRNGSGGFVTPIECPIGDRSSFGIRIGLLVTLQMVPSDEDDAPGAIEYG